MKKIDQHVFRAYDIRGIVDQDFDAEWVETLGKAVGTFFLRKGLNSCVIGHDCRHSSPEYQEAMARGLVSTGVDVVMLGMVATPIQYFGVCHLNRQAGVMITASHNPPEYNGFKVWAGVTTIHTTEIEAIYTIMKEGSFAEGQGVASELDIVPSYIDAVTSRVSPERKLKVVLDGGNGAGGLVCAEILRRIGCEVIEQYCEPDGSFPNHHPDPTVEANMQDLIARVQELGADVGLGLDGDGDRLGVVDANGRLLLGDEVLSLFARDILKKVPGGMIMGDVKCSHLFFNDIAEHGGVPLMWTTGHSVVKAKMHEEKAPLAGELSGHFFFNEGWFGFDDALYGAAKLMEILAESSVPLTELPGWEKTYSTPEVQITCLDSIKFEVIKQAQALFREKYDVNEIDGARITFADGWGLVRASNTQPVLVLRFEASSEERLNEIRDLVELPVRQIIKDLSGPAQ